MLNSQILARNVSYHYVEKYIFNGRDPCMNQYLKGIAASFLGNVNSQIPMDQIIEIAINQFSNETGDFSGINKYNRLSQPWVRTNPFTSALWEHIERKKEKDEDDVRHGIIRIST